jgi:hypothetical protein
MTIPGIPMDGDRANYAAERMLRFMSRWQHYAAEPVTDLEHATAKLRALVNVMATLHGDIVDHWHDGMIHGAPAEAFDNDGGGAPLLDPDIAEFHVRYQRKRKQPGAV